MISARKKWSPQLPTITILQEHVDFLQEKRIFLHSSERYNRTWLRIGNAYNTDKQPALMESYSGQFGGGAFSSLGAFSYSHSDLGKTAHVGRYCAIGHNAAIMASDHPVGWIGMCGFDYSCAAPYGVFARDNGAQFDVLSFPQRDETIVVEDGAWIGNDVLFAAPIRVGKGSVIAARSIVTKDVPPYAIVAGSPATVRKFRFPENTVERLVASDWTKYSFLNFQGMDRTDPERFLDQLEEAKTAGKINCMPERRIDVHAEFERIAAYYDASPTD